MLTSTCNCPTAPSRETLLQYIDEVSFAVYDVHLYLDTHPNDENAMAFFQTNIAARREAIAEYARLYGPLTIDTADDTQSSSWAWVEQPFPWEEKGACR
ncbi:MAG: spore coat protein CotJB [Blautia sp.]